SRPHRCMTKPRLARERHAGKPGAQRRSRSRRPYDDEDESQQYRETQKPDRPEARLEEEGRQGITIEDLVKATDHGRERARDPSDSGNKREISAKAEAPAGHRERAQALGL